MEILESAPRAPRMNAHCERIIGSIRREALDQTSYHPAPTNTPPRRLASAPAKSCAPGSSAASSTSTDTRHDMQR